MAIDPPVIETQAHPMNDSTAYIARTAKDSLDRGALVQSACVFVVTMVAYVALYSPLHFDDTYRFTKSVAAGEFQWDASHLLMQPATVVWHMVFGVFGDALFNQKSINTFSAAVTYAILYHLLCKLRVEVFSRVVLVLIAAVSYYMLVLGTSGSMHLTTSPWLAAALYQCVLWENTLNDPVADARDCRWRVMWAAVFLAIGTAFLINTVVVLPFLAIAMFVVLRHRKAAISEIWITALMFSVVFLALNLPIMGLGYYFALEHRAYDGFMDFIFAKNEEWDQPIRSVTMAAGQTVFSLAHNFVWLTKLAPILRAWLAGHLTWGAEYFRLIAVEVFYVGTTLLVLLVVYAANAWRIPRFDRPVLTPIAFFLGCVVFAFAWNFHEAAFYFPITLPTLVLLAHLRPLNVARCVMAAWAVMLVTFNIFGNAIPKAVYAAAAYEKEITATFGADDLFLHFEEWPGRQDLTQLDLRPVRHWPIDGMLRELGDPQAVLEQTRGQIDSTMDRGGRVMVFRMLDEYDWDAPWSWLPSRGLDKARLRAFFHEGYAVTPIGEIAEIRAWELRPRPNSSTDK